MKQQAVEVRDGQAPWLDVLGAKVSFLANADQTGGLWSIMDSRLPKDAGPPPHRHDWGEAYFLVEGEVMFEVEGEQRLLSAGDFLYAPPNTLHGFRGASEKPARMLVFDAPAHAAGFFHEVDAEVRSPADLPRVPEIGARNGIFFERPA